MIFKGFGKITGISIDPETSRGIIQGIHTKFSLDLTIGAQVSVSQILLFSEPREFTVADLKEKLTFQVTEVVNDNMLKVATITTADISKIKVPSGGVDFTVTPKIQQKEVFEKVTDCLAQGELVAVFPEGTSNERPYLLPLKPGVAVMAMEAAMKGIDDVIIVPFGIQYFDREKLQSTASLEFGAPLEITPEMVQQYRSGMTKKVVDDLMDRIRDSIRDVMVTARDDQVLDSINLCTSLFPPEKLRPSPEVSRFLYHMFQRIYSNYENEPKMVELTKELKSYQATLKEYGLADDEVWELKQTTEDVIVSLIKKLVALVFHIIVGVLPAVLWGILRVIASVAAEKRRNERLRNNSLKVTASDVVASFKVIVLIVVVPVANAIYGLALAASQGKLKDTRFVITSLVLCISLLPMLYYYSIRSFARISPLMHQSRSLFLVILGKINVWRETERRLVLSRLRMQLTVRALVDDYVGLQISEMNDEDKKPCSYLKAELDRCIPLVNIRKDSKRLQRLSVYYSPLTASAMIQTREEVL